MKKAFLVILVLTVFFISCDDNDMKDVNPFVGTWEDDYAKFSFTKTYLTIYDKSDDSVWLSGTYTYNDSNVYITTDFRISDIEISNTYPQPFVYSYLFESITVLFIGGRKEKTSS